VARFIQRAKFLPEELPVSEKFKIIKRNIRPYYQNKIWDNEVNSIDRLLDLCNSIGKTKLNIEKFQPHLVTPPKPKLVKCFSCKRTGHLSRNCPEAKSVKCGKSGYTVRTCPSGKFREDYGKVRTKIGDRRIFPYGRHLTTDDSFDVALDYVLATPQNNDAVYMNAWRCYVFLILGR
jgi:hypothetical protein